MKPRIRDVLREGTRRLQEAGFSRPRLEAEVLLAESLGRSRAYLVAHGEAPVPPAALSRYRSWLDRRARGEPLAYIVGYTWFYGLRLRVTPDVLIPRDETELLVELALHDLAGRHGAVRGVDVGTGSGAIAIALSVYGRIPVIATDISAPALRVARENVEALAKGGVYLVQADLLEPLAGPFHLVVANLPYVGWNEREVVAPEVREYEPDIALWAGQDGLALIRRFLAMAPARVAPGATIFLEIGYRQGAAVAALARAAFPGAHVQVHRDWAGEERVVEIRCPS